jgi:two-component system C4-dicarboxylate transport sensor histidine kinase DctB
VARGRFYLLLAAAVFAGLVTAALIFRGRRALQEEIVIAQRTRTLRDQLNQANRLATLGQISASVGHEINQPVAATRLFAENGERLLAAGRLEDAKGNFRQIVDLSDRIGRITAELRLFSRRDAPDPREMPVANAIEGALLLLRDRISGMGVVLTMPDEVAMTVRVRAEAVRLEQVIINLLQNALDAAGDGGMIEIVVTTKAHFCFVSIIDNGPGIDAQIRERLFQPFATTKASGLGLGLVISRDIMRDLGGDLTCEDAASGMVMTMKMPGA